MVYEDFSTLNLTCILLKNGVVSLSIPCFFQSPNLNVISMEVKPYKLNKGDYNIQFLLNYDGVEILSQISSNYKFQVLLNP